MFMMALFIIDETGKQSRWLCVGKWINSVHLDSGVLFSAFRKGLASPEKTPGNLSEY